MNRQSDPSELKKKKRAKRRLIVSACLMVGLSALMCLGAVVFVVYETYAVETPTEIIYSEELSAEELQISDKIFSGEQQTVEGNNELINLTLAAIDRQFEMENLFLGRSDRPTTRTGRWGIVNDSLWLEVLELDGEPVSHADLQFQIVDNALVGRQYDRERFNYDVFVLGQSGEVIVDSAE